MRWVYRFTKCMVLTGCLLTSGCASLTTGRDPWLGRDKGQHFAAAFLISAGGGSMLRQNGMDASDAGFAGFGVALSMGLGKEWYDRSVRRSFWSWRDLVWDVAGAAAGAWLVMESD